MLPDVLSFWVLAVCVVGALAGWFIKSAVLHARNLHLLYFRPLPTSLRSEAGQFTSKILTGEAFKPMRKALEIADKNPALKALAYDQILDDLKHLLRVVRMGEPEGHLKSEVMRELRKQQAFYKAELNKLTFEADGVCLLDVDRLVADLVANERKGA